MSALLVGVIVDLIVGILVGIFIWSGLSYTEDDKLDFLIIVFLIIRIIFTLLIYGTIFVITAVVSNLGIAGWTLLALFVGSLLGYACHPPRSQ